MKRNFPSFEPDRSSSRIIDEVIRKITKGQFQVEGFDITRTRGENRAKLKVKINGSSTNSTRRDFADVSRDRFPGPRRSDASLTPDEKEVQEQVANCYL